MYPTISIIPYLPSFLQPRMDIFSNSFPLPIFYQNIPLTFLSIPVNLYYETDQLKQQCKNKRQSILDRQEILKRSGETNGLQQRL